MQILQTLDWKKVEIQLKLESEKVILNPIKARKGIDLQSQNQYGTREGNSSEMSMSMNSIIKYCEIKKSNGIVLGFLLSVCFCLAFMDQ